MGLKLLLQSVQPQAGPFPNEEVQPRLPREMAVIHQGELRLTRMVARSDTEVAMWFLDKYSGSVAFRFPAAVNEILYR